MAIKKLYEDLKRMRKLIKDVITLSDSRKSNSKMDPKILEAEKEARSVMEWIVRHSAMEMKERHFAYSEFVQLMKCYKNYDKFLGDAEERLRQFLETKDFKKGANLLDAAKTHIENAKIEIGNFAKATEAMIATTKSIESGSKVALILPSEHRHIDLMERRLDNAIGNNKADGIERIISWIASFRKRTHASTAKEYKPLNDLMGEIKLYYEGLEKAHEFIRQFLASEHLERREDRNLLQEGKAWILFSERQVPKIINRCEVLVKLLRRVEEAA